MAHTAFEICWEVCNKVGGIFTVISSKAELMEHSFDDYYLIGPYFKDKVIGQFVEEKVPANLKPVFDAMRKKEVTPHFGSWLIEGTPKTILLDFDQLKEATDYIKKRLWEMYKIDSLGAGYDFNEVITWAWGAGMFLEQFATTTTDQITAQFHEWISGAGLLYLRSVNSPVKTIFTTHATMLGRVLGSQNINVAQLSQDELARLNPTGKAYESHIQEKHTTEKACAINAHVFTTVSETTAQEAKILLGKEVDVVLPNGLHLSRFPTFEESASYHKRYKEKLKEFVMSQFFPHYTFDIENTLFYSILGRYEMHVKGIDTFISSLKILNDQLMADPQSPTIVALIFVPAGHRGIDPEVIDKKLKFNDIRSSVYDVQDDVLHNLLISSILEKNVCYDQLIPEKVSPELKRKLLAFKKAGNPRIATHLIDMNDSILHMLLENGLDNRKENKVKMIFYPSYLTGVDGLLDLGYYETIHACHLGVFPSFYEPYGYTPLESAALSVAAITSDLSGFGKYIADKVPQKNPGIYILKREGKSDDEAVKSMAKIMLKFSMMSKTDRIEEKIHAHEVARYADWKQLIAMYVKAHQIALKR
ncbi:TPA: hypothetical protein HA296_05685 [Candidatus Woesearchaeota archaeon]|nr:hypothetical protein [Candidatus Woesearchaeota archaeon]